MENLNGCLSPMASLPTLRLATIVQVSVAGSYLNHDKSLIIDDITRFLDDKPD